MPLDPVTLTDPPLILRPFEARDVPAILDAATDPLIPLITSVPSPCDEVAALAFIERQHERLHTEVGWSLAITEGGQALGQIGLWVLPQKRASVGYWLTGSARGRGLAGRAVKRLCRFALKDARIERLELYVEPWNEASWRTAEKVGFQREGLMRQYQYVGPERRDMYLYSLLPEDLPSR
ncbi:Protein N-acetyltransferase, RimJ/RimL family [Deinococcus reticulitermitis]|uniref:Protein N-acetyltransferase, RimJ/RimL family n=1 Tax=Deinococcus reticulitermitis TaxID=856736 RepID=A0A1H6VR96_9DEIO|nr:GNAT family protein [Deinococcus reticulitermitis]SEJ05604.1 Protein N-acetyltransferase, RimJ/RimL family [Deinococcus reticulitermitis]